MNPTRWLIFAVVCIAAIGGLVFISQRESVNVNDTDPTAIEREGAFADRVYGNPDAKVVLIEYGDFACPGCGSASSTVTEVKQRYQDQMAFVYRHFPLTTIHPNALAAATVAEAAAKQGKFWQMHDLLFANGSQNTWEDLGAETRTQVFEDYARQIGLNIDQFKQDLTSEEVADKVNRDRALGRKVGVDSTPTFYLNGQKLESADYTTAGALDAKIREALKQAGVTVPAATEDPSDLQSEQQQ